MELETNSKGTRGVLRCELPGPTSGTIKLFRSIDMENVEGGVYAYFALPAVCGARLRLVETVNASSNMMWPPDAHPLPSVASLVPSRARGLPSVPIINTRHHVVVFDEAVRCPARALTVQLQLAASELDPSVHQASGVDIKFVDCVKGTASIRQPSDKKHSFVAIDGFPTYTLSDMLPHGRWYYECTLVASHMIQLGWVNAHFCEGNYAARQNAVGNGVVCVAWMDRCECV